MAGVEAIAVVGPTASGKTALAIRLAQALNAEIVSADSVQLYRGFDIGSGKPTPAELAAAPHHLIGVADPMEAWDASVFAEHADRVMGAIQARGRSVVICGGTFLWLRALIYGLAAAPPRDADIRARHAAWAEREGRAALHVALAAVDQASAARLNPNDFIRVSRALEVFELTGRPLSSLQEVHGFREPRFRVKLVGIRHDADSLTERIERRVTAMLAQGWREEVRTLVARGYRDTRAMQSVGYRQVLAAEEGPEPLSDAALIADVTRVTRIFARRQRTWLREQPILWLSPEEASDTEAAVDKLRAAPCL